MLMLQAEAVESICKDIDEADMWASSIQAEFHPTALPWVPESEPLEPLDVLQDALQRGDTAAAVLARAIAVYGPSGRERARDVYRRLVADGVGVPAWVDALGKVTPRRATVFTDVWEDEYLVWIDFTRADGAARGLGVEIDCLWSGRAAGFAWGSTSDVILAAADDVPRGVVRPIGLADARAMIAAGLKSRDAIVSARDDGDGDGGEDRYRYDEELRALVDQRIGLLPPGGNAVRRRRLTKRDGERFRREFLARNGGAGREDLENVFDKIRLFSDSCHDGDLLRWSPLKVGGFLAGWIPWKVIAGDEFNDSVEAVFPLWLEYAAERWGLGADLLAVNLSVARDSFGAMRRNAEDPSMRSPTTNVFREMLADGIDPMDPADSDAIQAWLKEYNARPRSERY